jgi:hypothetical protein
MLEEDLCHNLVTCETKAYLMNERMRTLWNNKTKTGLNNSCCLKTNSKYWLKTYFFQICVNELSPKWKEIGVEPKQLINVSLSSNNAAQQILISYDFI